MVGVGFPVKSEGKRGRRWEGGVGTSKGTGKSMRTHLKCDSWKLPRQRQPSKEGKCWVLFRPTFRVKSFPRFQSVLANFSRFFPRFQSTLVDFSQFQSVLVNFSQF